MDKGGESDKKSAVVDEREPSVKDKSGREASHRPTAATAERMVAKRGTTGDGGPEVKDKNGNGSGMPSDEVDDEAVSEGRNKFFRLEGAVYSIVGKKSEAVGDGKNHRYKSDAMCRKGMALVAMVIVLPSALTVGVLCDRDISGGDGGDSSGGTDGDSGGGIYGAGGLKEAIQDLYAEIIAYEGGCGSGGGSDPSATRLDDVASAKAKFVSESLLRMIGNIDTTDGAVLDGSSGDEAVEWKLRSKQKEVIDALKRYDETHGAKVSDEAAKHVNWLMDKCVQMALAKNVAMDGAQTTVAVKQIKHDDMGSLQKCFNDLLDRFERLRMSDITTVNSRGIYGHRSFTSSPSLPRPPPTPRPPRPIPSTKLPPATKPPQKTKLSPTTTKPPLTTRPPPPHQRTTRLVGRFKFRQFTHKKPCFEIVNAVADYQ